jgi:hypothetical protein
MVAFTSWPVSYASHLREGGPQVIPSSRSVSERMARHRRSAWQRPVQGGFICLENLFTQLFEVALTIPHELNDKLGDDRRHWIIAIH